MGKKSREKREQREIKALQKEVIPIAKSKIERICFEIIRWGTYLALLTPLIVDPRSFFLFVSPKSFYLWGLIYVIFTAYLVLLTVNFSRYRPRFTPILTAIVLLVAVFVLTSIIGVNLSNSFWGNYERMEGLLAWFHYLGFFIVLSCVFRQKKDWLRIFGVSVGVAVLVSIISFLWMDGASGLARIARQGSTLGGSSFLGTYLLFNIFLGVWLFIKSKKIWKIVWALCFGIMILALFLSGARAAMLSFMGGLFLLFLFYLIFQTRKPVFKITGAVILIAATVIAPIFLYLVFQPDSIIHQQLVERFGRARFVVWDMAWQGWMERPWLGWGMENFAVVFAKHFNPCLPLPECGGETWFDRAHNVVLDIGVTSGILGLLVYLSIFAISIYLLVKKYFKTKEFWVSAIFIVFLVAYFVQNLTVFDMAVSFMMFFLVLAFINIYTGTQEQDMVFQKSNSLSRGKKTIIALVIILMIFPFIEFVVQPARASRFIVNCIKGQGLNFNQRTDYCQKAVNTSSLGKYQVRERWAQFVIDTSHALRAEQNISFNDFRAEFLIIVEEKKKSIAEHPLCFRSHLILGHLYNSYPFVDRNYFSEAEEILARAIELSPTNQKGYQILAQTKLLQGKHQEAKDLLIKARDLEPRLPIHNQ